MGKRAKPGSASPSGEVQTAGGRSLGVGGGVQNGGKAAEALGEARGCRVLRATGAQARILSLGLFKSLLWEEREF